MNQAREEVPTRLASHPDAEPAVSPFGSGGPPCLLRPYQGLPPCRDCQTLRVGHISGGCLSTAMERLLGRLESSLSPWEDPTTDSGPWADRLVHQPELLLWLGGTSLGPKLRLPGTRSTDPIGRAAISELSAIADIALHLICSVQMTRRSSGPFTSEAYRRYRYAEIRARLPIPSWRWPRGCSIPYSRYTWASRRL